MNQEEKIILPDSPEAAEYKTITDFFGEAEKEQVNAWEPGEFRTEYLGCDRT